MDKTIKVRTYELKYTKNHVLILSLTERYNSGEFYYNEAVGEIYQAYIADKSGSTRKKIIAHRPLQGGVELEGVLLLPELTPLKIAFEATDNLKEYKEELSKKFKDTILQEDQEDKILLKDDGAFIMGFERAKSIYKFTEADMVKMAIMAWNDANAIKNGDHLNINELALGYARHIKQAREWPTFFAANMVAVCGSPLTVDRCPKCTDTCEKKYTELETTTDSEGRKYLVGKYILEQS